MEARKSRKHKNKEYYEENRQMDRDENTTITKTEKNHTAWSRVGRIVFWPLAVVYLELVIGCSTSGLNVSRFLVYLFFFSCSYGLLLSLIGSFFKNNKVNDVVQGGLLCVMAILFCALYFLFCEFRMFYDFQTMFAGATDAIGDFSGDILSMIGSPDGAGHIILFFLPFALYLIFGKKLDLEQRIGWKEKAGVFGLAVVIWFFTVSGIYLYDTDVKAYHDQYNFNTAIADFGLLTGIRLELNQMLCEDEQEMVFEYVDDGSGDERKKDASQSENTADKDAADVDVAEAAVTDAEAMETAVADTGEENADRADNNTNINARKQTEKQTKQTLAQKEADEVKKPTGKNQMDIDFHALAEKDGGNYAALDEYVSSLKATEKNEYTGYFAGKNLIFITAEAFTDEAIDRERTPTLYRLAHKGIEFTDYYQPASAGTTGGEYSNLFGMLPTAGGSSMKKTANHLNWSTLSSRLSEMGYYGKAFHNNDYTYYDRHKTHINLGFSDGYEGKGNGLEKVLTRQWPESDLEMMKGTLSTYIKKEPFHIYYMTVSGHSLYSFDKNAMSKKHKDKVEKLPYSEPVKAYLACQIELEEALAYLVGQLERLNMADDTVIVISTDHFPYGLDQDSGNFVYLEELYGRPIIDNLDRDHSRLIIWSGCLEKEKPIRIDEPVSSMDILPTLCNLFGVRYDSRLLVGRDVFSGTEPLVFNLGYDWKTDKGTYIAARGKFTPANKHEELPEDYVSRINAIVKNKITYSKGVLSQDYFRHVFSRGEGESAD